jgi:uncharacterized protein
LIGFIAVALILFSAPAHAAQSSADLPELTQPVNDFAHVVDAASAAEIDRLSRALQAATGDVVVVATVPTVEPYGDINEYAVKERRVRIEVGYGLEQWITDGYAGSTSREVMTPEFRAGRYGGGLRAGAEQVIARIAQARNISIQGLRAPRVAVHPTRTPIPVSVPFIVFIVLLVISRLGGGRGGGFGGGFGGFGGGGFGGFGGGGSGGGGGGSSW